jgi:hypothetical protein
VKGARWTEEEDTLIRENPDVPAEVLAAKLNRATGSVWRRKSQLGVHVTENWCATGRRRDGEESDTDTRPSGWYVEVIGTLLMHYEDAFNSWKHFHRYTEVKVMSADDRRGWTTLLCRRNSIAP